MKSSDHHVLETTPNYYGHPASIGGRASEEDAEAGCIDIDVRTEDTMTETPTTEKNNPTTKSCLRTKRRKDIVAVTVCAMLILMLVLADYSYNGRLCLWKWNCDAPEEDLPTLAPTTLPVVLPDYGSACLHDDSCGFWMYFGTIAPSANPSTTSSQEASSELYNTLAASDLGTDTVAPSFSQTEEG